MPITSVTVAGITAKILIDGYRKGIRQGQGPWREILYIVPWVDSDDFMDALMGVPTLIGTNVFPVPHQYPGNPWLYCVDVDGQGVGVPQYDATTTDPFQNKLWAAEDCIVRARYEALPYLVNAGQDPGGSITPGFDGGPFPFAAMDIRHSFKTVRAAKEELELEDGPGAGEAPAHDVEFVIPQTEYSYTLKQIGGLQDSVIRALSGKLNDAPFFGNDTGTLLFMGGDSHFETGPTGSPLRDVSFTITWQPFDHNAILGPDGVPTRVSFASGGGFAHEYADFTLLLVNQ